MIDTEASLVREALVREIHEAKRWSAVVEAWQALLKVREMANSIQNERTAQEQCAQGFREWGTNRSTDGPLAR